MLLCKLIHLLTKYALHVSRNLKSSHQDETTGNTIPNNADNTQDTCLDLQKRIYLDVYVMCLLPIS